MTNFKPIESIIQPPPIHWVGDGFIVHGFFPEQQSLEKRMSPFFLLDYNSKFEFSPSQKQRGVGVHPHRGIETVTIAYHGKVAHHDSTGNSGVIGEGDVQWMTAGSGILHKEYHEKEFSKKGGLFQMVQLWVNLPAKYKMTQPKYQPILKNEMGNFEIPNDGGKVYVIAGEYKDVKGPASTFSPINLYNVYLKTGFSVDFNFPENYNTGFLIIEGEVNVNDSKVAKENSFILFKNSGTDIILSAEKDCTVLVMNGEAINEPLAHYGPFLMNTKEELQQAFEDYQNGLFGHLED
ncbi:MAG: short-chain dehydrogenase [Bacteroidetes bacterium GWA2_31_9]|nr:MAG: short-chain dehydrogenase [Bacteroidetes bacterium GWA2_31_9]